MRILILTLGSRGDVQPFVALGKGLKLAGHEVTVCTSAVFQGLIAEHSLDYAYMNDELIQLLESDTGRAAIEKTQNWVGWIRTSVGLYTLARRIYGRVLDEAWAAAKGAEVVIYHPKALAGYHIAEKLGIPGFSGALFPIVVPTRYTPMLGFPNLKLGGWYNELTYKIPWFATQASYAGMVNRWRKDSLGLPGRSIFANDRRLPNGRPAPVLHGYSPQVVPTPADWPDTAVTTGYWFLDQTNDWEPQPELANFLDAGPPPVYVGFGSMAGRNPEKVTRTVIDALGQSGQRGLIATGWGGLQTSDLPANVFKIDQAPHDWLFPRVAAIIHHGGAGTTAAALRSGKPMVICPFFGDQPFWGRRVHELGVSVEPIHQKKLTADNLSAAIRETLASDTIRIKADEVGRLIREEDGVGNAVRFIESQVNSGYFSPN